MLRRSSATAAAYRCCKNGISTTATVSLYNLATLWHTQMCSNLSYATVVIYRDNRVEYRKGPTPF